MKMRLLVTAALLVLLSVGAFAVDFTDYGYQVIATRQENNQSVYDLKDQAGVPTTVTLSAPVTADDGKTLQAILSTFEGWDTLKIDHVRIVFTGTQSADVLVVPTSFLYKSVDLAAYMPSGMQFSYAGYLEYDFRLLKDNLFLRLKGQLYDETQFADRLLNAIQNPILYLQTTNPEYLLQKINDLAARIDNLTNAVKQQGKDLSDSMQQSVSDLKQSASQAADRQAAIDSDINHQLGVMSTQLGALADQDKNLQQQLGLIRYALITLNNRDFFGTVHAVNPDGIAKVLELRKANPTMTTDQVTAELQKEGIKMSKKEVALVFAVYFNEF